MPVDLAPTRQRVLFLCTHNSARSQMAEGLLRSLGGERFEVHSAGTQATRVRPLAIRAMGELGIDISAHASKTLDRYLQDRFDKVITVCDDANETCPVFNGARERVHWSFPDPSAATGTEDEQLALYRQVRDAIRLRIEQELLSVDAAAQPTARTRLARMRDAAAIARIYNHGIEDGIATFQNQPRTIADVEHMLEQRGARFPTVVVERDGRIVAWASAGTYRATAWYESILEHSVYVDRDQRGTGVGGLALNALIDEAERRGFLKLVSRIFVENAASRALHLKCGFREVGIYQRHGKLNGVWHDCVIVERLLGSARDAE